MKSKYDLYVYRVWELGELYNQKNNTISSVLFSNLNQEDIFQDDIAYPIFKMQIRESLQILHIGIRFFKSYGY